MTALATINEFNISTTSKVAMVQESSELLESGKIDSPSVLIAIGIPVDSIPRDVKRANLVMQYTVSNLIDGQSVTAAFIHAGTQVERLVAKHPFLNVGSDTAAKSPTTDKKARAYAIYLEMTAANASTIDIVKKIATDLDITQANSRYYITRCGFAK